MTTLALSGTAAPGDAHIVFIRPDRGSLQILGSHKLKQPEAIIDALLAVGATGANGELTMVPAGKASPAPMVVAVGLGTSEAMECIRRGAGNAVRKLVGRRKALLAPPDRDEAVLRAVVEGALMAAYSFDEYRTAASEKQPPVKSIALLVDRPSAAMRAVVKRAEVTAAAVNGARDLANTPANDL